MALWISCEPFPVASWTTSALQPTVWEADCTHRTPQQNTAVSESRGSPATAPATQKMHMSVQPSWQLKNTKPFCFFPTQSLFFISLEKQENGAKPQFLIVSCRIFLISDSGVIFQEATKIRNINPPIPWSYHSRIIMRSINPKIKN